MSYVFNQVFCKYEYLQKKSKELKKEMKGGDDQEVQEVDGEIFEDLQFEADGDENQKEYSPTENQQGIVEAEDLQSYLARKSEDK